MDDWDGIILFIFGAIVVVGLVFGVMTAIKKSFHAAPSVETNEADKREKEFRQKMEDTKEEQKRLMERQRQQLQDSQRNK